MKSFHFENILFMASAVDFSEHNAVPYLYNSFKGSSYRVHFFKQKRVQFSLADPIHLFNDNEYEEVDCLIL